MIYKINDDMKSVKEGTGQHQYPGILCTFFVFFFIVYNKI